MEETDIQKFREIYGDNIFEFYSKYKELINYLLEDNQFNIRNLQVLNEQITDEERRQIIGTAIKKSMRNRSNNFENLKILKMMVEFVPLREIPMGLEKKNILLKYGIDKLIEADFNLRAMDGYYVVNIEKMNKLQKILDKQDFMKIVAPRYKEIIEKCGIENLLEIGIKDISELDLVEDLYTIQKLSKKVPLTLINMGNKTDFIIKYGIDNIIALEEETKGIFSHKCFSHHFDSSNTYFSLFISLDQKEEENQNMSYKEFKNTIYEMLNTARRDEKILAGEKSWYAINYDGTFPSGTANGIFRYTYPNYDFIQGDFRNEHPEIFINENIDDELKEKFYRASMKAEDIREHPEIIEILKEKKLEYVFKENSVLTLLETMQKNFPNNQEKFLQICARYGKCLDNLGEIAFPEKITEEKIIEIIENNIYNQIKEKGIEYFEDLPDAFKEKHPELFLPKEIDEQIRVRFYEGKLSYYDIRHNAELRQIILSKDMEVGFSKLKYFSFAGSNKREINPFWENSSNEEIIEFARKYGKYLETATIELDISKCRTTEEKDKIIQDTIEGDILVRRISKYNEEVPEFFKEKHSELFLDEDAPEELKNVFYDDNEITFYLIKKHPEWKQFLEGKDLSRAFNTSYKRLFQKFSSETLLNLKTASPRTLDVMSDNVEILEKWYNALGGKFLPHHTVMLEFPDNEIDKFLGNSKKWSQLMKIEGYDAKEEVKSGVLKLAYNLGVFEYSDEAFNRIMEMLTGVEKDLSIEEYNEVIKSINEDEKKTFAEIYQYGANGRYNLTIDKQKDKQKVKQVRKILEKSGIDRILTPEKVRQIFGAFSMQYHKEFAEMLNDNIVEILTNPEYTKDISAIQRQFKDILIKNAGRHLTLEVARDFVKNNDYENIDVGNEDVAEQAKIVGYSQESFDVIQELYNEGETREFSSIPRIEGKQKGYTYEILRLDDSLALIIGALTDCCQELNHNGQQCMEHSMISLDGRVFVVKNEVGKIVAQSWIWRNQNVLCFDNIEIPKRIMIQYKKEHPDIGKKGIIQEVLAVYKKAAQELMEKDKSVYQELLQQGEITREQFDELLLGKITVGIGFNDIKSGIKADKDLVKDDAKNLTLPQEDGRWRNIYTDAAYKDDGEHEGQWIIKQSSEFKKSSQPNLHVYEDDIPVYDTQNMKKTILTTMQRMEATTRHTQNLAYVGKKINQTEPYPKELIERLAEYYELDPNTTKIMATARMVLVYSLENDKVKIGEFLTAPIKNNITADQKNKAENHIRYQLKKALKQLDIKGNEDVEVLLLDKKQRQLLENVIGEMEKENIGR